MKKEKNIFEIYLTSAFVESKQWLQLIYKISKINGKFKSWNLWINIENNYIRYFVETNTMLPPILGELGEFLIKKQECILNKKARIDMPYILTNNYKTFYL